VHYQRRRYVPYEIKPKPLILQDTPQSIPYSILDPGDEGTVSCGCNAVIIRSERAVKQHSLVCPLSWGVSRKKGSRRHSMCHCSVCCSIFVSWKELYRHKKLYDHGGHHKRKWSAKTEDGSTSNESRCIPRTEGKGTVLHCDHDGCHRVFGRMELWNKHRQTHRKPYRCSYALRGCTQSFATRSDCRFHERIHREDKCEKCAFCCKAFTDPAALRKHIKYVHGTAEEKPFSCKECKKRFARKESLQKHWGTHSKVGEMNYYCKVCRISFTLKSNYERHQRRFH